MQTSKVTLLTYEHVLSLVSLVVDSDTHGDKCPLQQFTSFIHWKLMEYDRLQRLDSLHI